MNRIMMGSAVALILAAGACRNHEPPSRTPEPPPEPSIRTSGASLRAPDTTAGSGQGPLSKGAHSIARASSSR
jgi:hypothetical protein